MVSGYNVNSKNKARWIIYCMILSATLLFHIFNNLQISESIKIFHLTAAAALIFALFLLEKPLNKIEGVALLFIVSSFVSCELSPFTGSEMVWLKLFIIVSSVSFVQTVPSKYIITCTNIIIPIILLALLIHYFTGSYFRFQGFYNDPNYLCVSLLVVYFYIQLAWETNSSKFIKVILCVEILLIFLLISTTVSRTGLICFCLMSLIFWGHLFLKNKIATVCVCALMVCFVTATESNIINKVVHNYTERKVQQGDTMDRASKLRREIALRGVNYVVDNPQYWLQGIGMGGSSHASSYSNFHVRTHHGDHNTFTSSFTEQGIIGCILYLCLLYSIFKQIYKNQTENFKRIRLLSIAAFFIFCIFSMSVNLMVYFPFWFVLFTLANISNDENITYSLLR